jgi:acyl carrier protein
VRGAVLVDELTRLVAEIAELDSPELIDPQRGFFDLGLDSLRALRLIERLQALLGRPLSPTLTFDYPTIAALATHLAAPAEAPRRPTAAAPQQDGEVAVIGISCRFPGGADSPATYWHLLHRAGDAITDLPDGRWDLD